MAIEKDKQQGVQDNQHVSQKSLPDMKIKDPGAQLLNPFLHEWPQDYLNEKHGESGKA